MFCDSCMQPPASLSLQPVTTASPPFRSEDNYLQVCDEQLSFEVHTRLSVEGLRMVQVGTLLLRKRKKRITALYYNYLFQIMYLKRYAASCHCSMICWW